MRYAKTDSHSLLKPELLPDEKILWAGQPDQTKMFEVWDLFLVPFSVLWLGFAIMWTTLALAGGGFMGILGIPFLLAGIYITIGRFFVKTRTKKYTYYAVTDRRVLILRTYPTGRKKFLTAKDLNKIYKESSYLDRQGRGTIIFGRIPPGYRCYLNTGLLIGPQTVAAFCDIAECDNVLRTYQEAKKNYG